VGSMVIEKYSFKKGQRLHLDHIYLIQGIGGNDWWEPIEEGGDNIIITQDIKIKIEYKKGERQQ